MNRFSKFIWILNILLIISTFCAYISPTIDPETFAFPAIFGLAMPYLFLLNLIFVLFWGFAKPIYALASLITILFGMSAIGNLISFSPKKKIVKDQFTVASYNIHSAYKARSYDSDLGSKKAKGYKKYLQNFSHVDVLSVQENCHFCDILINQALDYKFQHRIEHKGTSIYSRLPILDAGEIDFGTRINSCIWADIAVQDTVVRLYSIHLQSNRISQTASDLAESKIIEKETFIGLKKMLGEYSKYVKVRAKQAKDIKAHAANSPYPVIFTGDFNDTPQSFVYKTLNREMKDAFIQAGDGLGATFGGALPGLRIDYILTDPSIEHLNYKMLKGRYSDHYPIISNLTLRNIE